MPRHYQDDDVESSGDDLEYSRRRRSSRPRRSETDPQAIRERPRRREAFDDFSNLSLQPQRRGNDSIIDPKVQALHNYVLPSWDEVGNMSLGTMRAIDPLASEMYPAGDESTLGMDLRVARAAVAYARYDGNLKYTPRERNQHLVEKDFNEVTFPGTNDPQAYASTYERRVEGSGDEAEHPVKGILKSPSTAHSHEVVRPRRRVTEPLSESFDVVQGGSTKFGDAARFLRTRNPAHYKAVGLRIENTDIGFPGTVRQPRMENPRSRSREPVYRSDRHQGMIEQSQPDHRSDRHQRWDEPSKRGHRIDDDRRMIEKTSSRDETRPDDHRTERRSTHVTHRRGDKLEPPARSQIFSSKDRSYKEPTYSRNPRDESIKRYPQRESRRHDSARDDDSWYETKVDDRRYGGYTRTDSPERY